MAIEIVDLPINSMVIFHSYVSLPEGIYLVVHPMDRFCGLSVEFSGLSLP